MAEARRSGYCKDCERRVVVFRPRANHLLHLLLTLITAGLWLPIWLGLAIRIGGWRCAECGSTRIRQVR